ncbi:VOC family protein [Pseudonocardia xinjiangensis]|uniref:VOC family protein n=1 Tax=Pseudonocardia xinjiangensis TaxID=75289 RepID=UPI003D9163C9
MTDAFDALRIPDAPATPDPEFADGLRIRVERAVLDRPDDTVTATEATIAEPATPEPASTTDTTVGDATTGTTTGTTTAAAVLPLHTVTPYLAVSDARAAVEFYIGAFGAARRGEPVLMPDGRIGHVEVVLGDSVLMMADEFPELDLLAPVTRGGSTQSLRLEVTDPDAVVDRALAAGGVLERPVTDSPYGRGGVVLDPFGHRWMVSREPARPRTGDIVHASLWTADVERAERFYAAVLGWTVEPGSGPQHRRVTNAGARLGLSGGHDRSTLMLCFAVPDVDAAVAVVRAAGGTAGEPADQPPGRVADCVDDLGVPFALRSGPPGPVPGSDDAIAHLVLRVPDAGRARAFYGTVLGWGFVPARVANGWNVRTAAGEPRPRTSIWGGRSEPAVVVPSFAVPDLAAAVQAVRAAGGTGAGPERRPFGRAAECTDDQGGRFQLVER